MKTNVRAYRAAVAVAFLVAFMVALCPASAVAGDNPANPLHVNATLQPGGVRIEARASSAFEFSTSRPSEQLFVADLVGVTVDGPQSAHMLDSQLVSSYRVIQSHTGDIPVARIEILLRNSIEPRVSHQGANDVTFSFDSKPAVSAVAAPKAAAVAAMPETKPNSSARAKSIDGLSLDALGQQTRVRMKGDGRLAYEVSRLSNPDRLIFDFNGAQLRLAKHSLSGTSGAVSGVRAAQHTPDLARVVIDLAGTTPYSVTADGNAVTVLFGPAPAAPAMQSPASSPSADTATSAVASSVMPGQIPSETFNSMEAAKPSEPAKEISTVVPVALNEQAKPEVVKQPRILKIQDQGRLVEVALSTRHQVQPVAPAVKPEAMPTASMAIPEIPVPAPAILARPDPARLTPAKLTPAKADAPVAASAEKQPEMPSAAQPTPVVPVRAAGWGRQTSATSVTPVNANAARYSGEPISVNLKDVDLKDFFRLIHEISGLNVVLDPAVKGTLTIVLDDVPWDQALDIVLQNNGLEKQLDGNVLRIATTDTVKREAEGRRDLVKAEAEAVGQVTATRVLSYAKATALRDTLKRFLSARGDILSDERSNTLIIRDIPSVLPDIDALIKQLDRKSQQVEIEARVVSASRTFSREIGTQFGLSAAALGGRNIFGGLAGNAGFVSPLIRGAGLPAPPLVSSGSTAMPLISNLGVPAPTSGFSFAHSSPNFALDYIISAAEAKGVGKLLSKPKVITQNNEKATVKQGSKIPVQTVINNTISTQFIDAVLKLEVTPQITAEGTVYMEVVVENTAIDNGVPRVQNIPALSTQSAETKVLVNDGGTVVIGGVIISNQRTDVAQVPLLGSIPIIGHLFKRTTVSTSSQELLFFLTPRIVPT